MLVLYYSKKKVKAVLVINKQIKTKRIEITQSMFYNQNGIKLEMRKKFGKFTNIGKLNNTLN